MSDDINKQGGPAFPVSIPGCGDNGWQGMSLRDYFAGQALIGLAMHLDDARQEKMNNKEARANWEASIAYHLADAMLEQRNQKS